MERYTVARIRIKPLDRIGHLTVIRDTGKRSSIYGIVWLCHCDCGQYVEKTTHYLHSNIQIHSCGCQRGEANVKHGDTRKHEKESRLHRIWRGMLWRCNVKNRSKYSYAKKGIRVCEEWLNYKTFKSWTLENGYTDCLTIDRVDIYGNYEPDNCRWATVTEQANNKSNNHLLTHEGKTMTLAEWARESGVNYSTLRSRVNRQGLSLDKALSRGKGTRDKRTGRFVGGYDISEDDAR